MFQLSGKNMKTNNFKSPFLKSLKLRDFGLKNHFRAADFPKSMRHRINDSFNKIFEVTMELRNAIESMNWIEIESAVGTLITRILDNVSSNSDQLFQITPIKKQEREIFVSLGGMHLLLKLLGSPLNDVDCRSIPSSIFQRRGELWNEILVVLREVCFAIPSLADNLFSKQHIVFLFTMLSHLPVYENTMNLLEEILAVRVETFNLSEIPDLYSLLDKFTTRQLAHFCRVLALVLFEPEDRQILECSQILRSFELLQLRRDRMAKVSNIVEQNQSLIIEMPQLLARLISLLNIINYGPTLSELIRHNIVAQSPLTSDILYLLSTSNEASEWQHFSNLDSIVQDSVTRPSHQYGSSSSSSNHTISNTQPGSRNYRISRGSQPSSSQIHINRNNSNSPSNSNSNSSPNSYSDTSDSDDIMNDLLAAFAPTLNDNGSGFAAVGGVDMPMNNILSIIQVAQNLGIASVSSHGDAIYLSSSSPIHGTSSPGTDTNNSLRTRPRRRHTPLEAKQELQFQAMILAPHQVELLFVLCTLLSGRRKLDVQHKFAALDLSDILLKMFSRLSWDSPPFIGPNPLEHIHGPGCECNPESALRVQYLRLVHNFYDRDFINNPNKTLLLSALESEYLKGGVQSIRNGGLFITGKESGLLSKITTTLLNEPASSIYRFWLCSCLEAYLRGSGNAEQMFVVKSTVLQHLLQHIIASGCHTCSNLQTTFDLLGELVKCNRDTLELFEEYLVGDQFHIFMEVVLGNLVDSNVFLRSLFLSLEKISTDFSGSVSHTNTSDMTVVVANQSVHSVGYLTHSWVHFSPTVLSKRALDLLRKSHHHMVSKSTAARRTSYQSSRPTAPFMLGASALTSLSEGVRDAFRGLRDAASQLLSTASSSNTFNANTNTNTTTSFSPSSSSSSSSVSPHRREVKRNMTSIQSEIKIKEKVKSGNEKISRQLMAYEDDYKKEKVVANNDIFITNTSVDAKLGKYQCQDDQSSSIPLLPSESMSLDDYTDNSLIEESKVSAVESEGNIITFTAPSSLNSDENNKYSSSTCSSGSGFDNNNKSMTSQTYMKLSKESVSEAILLVPPAVLPLPAPTIPTTAQSGFLVDEMANSPSIASVSYFDATSTTNITVPSTRTTSSSPSQPCTTSTTATTTSTSSSSSRYLPMPSTLRRISQFLQKKREIILYQLMETVTIHTVNHENICCLNTALIIFILAHQRNQLADVLYRVKEVILKKQKKQQHHTSLDDFVDITTTEVEYHYSLSERIRVDDDHDSCLCTSTEGYEVPSLQPLPLLPSTSPPPSFRVENSIEWEDINTNTSCNQNSSKSNSSSSKDSETKQMDIELSDQMFLRNHHNSNNNQESNCTSSTSNVDGNLSEFLNFRELLWYWEEYYTRRGRDRLSLEFSSHIPFRFWLEVVGLLCKDNGSPTSLLMAPMALPQSPYTLHARPSPVTQEIIEYS